MRRPYHAPKVASSHRVYSIPLLRSVGHFIEYCCKRCHRCFYATPITNDTLRCPACDNTNVQPL